MSDVTETATPTAGRSLRSELHVVRGLTYRWYREMLISPVGLVVMLGIRPVVWYLLFGSLFQGITALEAFPVEDYRAFILPGVAVMMALEYVSLGGQCIVDDFDRGFLHKLWVSPARRVSVVAGRTIVMTGMSVVQTSMLLALAAVDGVQFAAGPLGVLTIIGLAGLLAATMTGLSMTVAYLLRYEFAFSAVTSFLILPVIFVSNAFAPTSLMPDWLATIADANLVSVAITGMRSLVVEGWVAADLLPAIGLLTAMTVVSLGLAAVTFTRTVEPDEG